MTSQKDTQKRYANIMNLQNLYRATTKDDKCCHKTFRNIQAKKHGKTFR